MTRGDRAGEHIDLETLAELDEGLLEERADSLRAHLASCPQCQQRAADLTEVRRALAAAPAPTMPSDVADRIDTAITTAARDDRVVPLRRPLHRRRVFQVAVAAAAVVVVAVGGVATTRAILTGGGTVSSAEGSGPGAGPPTAGAPQPMSGAPVLPVLTTNTNYGAGSMDDQVAALVRDRMARGSPEQPDAGTGRVPTALQQLTEPDRLRGCIEAATGDADRRPVVVDLARYEGRPAAVIVLPSGASGRLDVWVVGGSCSPGNPDVLLRTQVSG